MEAVKTFLKQNYAKLKDLYVSMTLGNRIVASLLMVTLLVSLGYLIVGGIKPADPRSKTVRLFDGYMFSPNEKRAAEYALSQAGLSEGQWIGDQLQVPVNRRHQYTAVLAAENVLDKKGFARQGMANTLSPWENAKMMDTKMLTAKEQDCVDSIKMLNGIADVKVISNKRPSWERNVWARTQIPSVAVTVEAIENKPLSIETIGAIGRIVTSAFGITDVKEISIVDTNRSRAYDGSGEELSSAQGEYLRHQTRYQEEWNNRLYQHLSHIKGLRIETSVDLTTYRKERSFGVEHGKPTPLVTHEMDYHFHREGWERFFRPGQVAQWGSPLIDPTGNVSPKDITDEKKREQEITNALQGTETEREQVPYIPVRVTVSIQIPREHILAVWQSKNRQLGNSLDSQPTAEQLRAEEEELTTTTKRSVAKLLEFYRISSKTDPLDLIDVGYFDPVRPVEVELTAWEQFVLFLQNNWQTLSLMSLVFSGLVVLWLISKPQKPDSIVIYEGLETPLEAIDARIAEKIRREEEAAAAAAAAAAEAQEIFENSLGELGSLRSLKDEIAELIAKNPEAAAAVIRQWIGNAVLVEAKT